MFFTPDRKSGSPVEPSTLFPAQLGTLRTFFSRTFEERLDTKARLEKLLEHNKEQLVELLREVLSEHVEK
jgi:hypothetical protein